MKLPPIPDNKKHNEFLRNRADKAIYLGINTNINCLDSWYSPYQNHKIGLYLGKITFKKNKQNNLAPIYTPSNIQDIAKQVSATNSLWLDGINKDCIKPTTFKEARYTPTHNLVEVLCQRSDKNIILDKNQIVSYFTELHSLNTAFIKNYIDSINKENGIKAYNLHKEIFSNLLEAGILQKDMFEWYNNGNFSPSNKATLLTLDYLKANNQANFKIVLFDELFYAYLVWSLKEYTILYYQGYIVEQNNLIFNPSAYVDFNATKGIDSTLSLYDKLPQDLQDEMTFCRNAYWITPKDGFFHTESLNYIPSDEKGHYCVYNKKSGYSFSSPNNTAKRQITLYDEKQEPIFMPSPLGKYYFELSDSLGSFIEYFPKIYPQKPPKYWSKEMMSKLDLRLE